MTTVGVAGQVSSKLYHSLMRFMCGEKEVQERETGPNGYVRKLRNQGNIYQRKEEM